MSATPEHALYRLRRTRRDGVSASGYRGTWELSDDRSKQMLATCDLMSVVTFRAHDIVDGNGKVWRLAANRAVMPSRWLLTSPTQRLVLQIDQPVVRKLLNPWRATGFLLLDGEGKELFRLVDGRTGLLARIFGPSIDEWVLMQGTAPVAKLVRLPKEREEPKGLLGHVGKVLSRTDQGIASTSSTHVLDAPSALALLMLVNELTDSSGVA
jgi:hypothetical protein